MTTPPLFQNQYSPTQNLAVGAFVVAEKSWPEMGNAGGHGYSIAKIIKRTPTGKWRIKELPTRQEGREDDWFQQTSSWTTYVISLEPDPTSNKSLLIGPDGVWHSGRYSREYKVVEQQELGKGFREVYDLYS